MDLSTTTKGLSFSDITLVPADFTNVRSRRDVNIVAHLPGRSLTVPVVSSNMDSVYSPELSREILRLGGMSCVHRFCTVEDNIFLFKAGIYRDSERNFEVKPWVSVGLGEEELNRAKALKEAGAEVVLIDVANAASQACVDQFIKLRSIFDWVIVGNFGTHGQIQSFLSRIGPFRPPDLIKVSIGSGSMCTTRITTGVGLPSVTTILDCKKAGIPMIFDGGITNSGDLAKALALGCAAVMCGKLFCATYESGGKRVNLNTSYIPSPYIPPPPIVPDKKVYRGSASLSSYIDQGKDASFRAPEGEETLIAITGTVEDLMNRLSGGLRSSMSYLNAFTLDEFKANARFLEISASSKIEGMPHGKE